MKHLFSLLEKYDVPGPRYTSYPTVPAWTENVGIKDYQVSLASLKENENLSLYFHMPFCERLCHFCGCMQVITKDHSKSAEYTEVLIQEIENVAAGLPLEARQVSQVHFGGGTPNFFRPEEYQEIFSALHEHFDLVEDAEIAMEMHPRTATENFCDVLPKLGFNRISLGVQDFDDRVQKLIHRGQSFGMTKKMILYLRSLGFQSFNLDLVYGLPGQTLETWEQTLKLVLGLEPNRLAVYSYAHVPWVRPVQRAFKDEDLPDAKTKLKLFEKAIETFTANGFELIGMDHFARKDDELSLALKQGSIHRNFMGYSTRADAHQIGMGVSAISYVAGNYFQNAKKNPDYYEKISKSTFATYRGFLLDRDDQIHRDLITQIMCNGRINIDRFSRKWEVDFFDYFPGSQEHLNSFVKDGLAEFDDASFKVIGLGSLFLRNIAMGFDPYLQEIQRGSQTPVFSRTV